MEQKDAFISGKSERQTLNSGPRLYGRAALLGGLRDEVCNITVSKHKSRETQSKELLPNLVIGTGRPPIHPSVLYAVALFPDQHK